MPNPSERPVPMFGLNDFYAAAVALSRAHPAFCVTVPERRFLDRVELQVCQSIRAQQLNPIPSEADPRVLGQAKIASRYALLSCMSEEGIPEFEPSFPDDRPTLDFTGWVVGVRVGGIDEYILEGLPNPGDGFCWSNGFYLMAQEQLPECDYEFENNETLLIPGHVSTVYQVPPVIDN